MLVEGDFKNQDSRIRRKAYSMGSPVQAKRSSGLAISKTYGLLFKNKNSGVKNDAEVV